MRIAVPVAAYHEGNTGEYVVRAFRGLGHTAEILSQWEFYSSLKKKGHDLYFCVDSGGALNLLDDAIGTADFSKVCFWFIDFRHNKNRKERQPTDLMNAAFLAAKGGWVFQSQYEDFLDCMTQHGIYRSSWLPLAADPEVWSATPVVSNALYDVGFVGNVWDGERHRAIELLQQSGLQVAFAGPGVVWKESAAALLRSCKMGFNISSFFGEPYAYDINMRVFETLSCGIPLITNMVPSLNKLFDGKAFVATYEELDKLVSKIRYCLEDSQFLASGIQAREWVEAYATYRARMHDALEVLQIQSVMPGPLRVF